MFKNYFKTALRTLIKNKLYTILNVAGITFGLSCFILIGLYLFDELTFDTQHSKANRIYRVIEHATVNGESTTIAGGSYKLAEESRKKIPGVENTTRIQRTGRANILSPENPENFFQETVTVADENFLEIFDFPLVAGDKKNALTEPNSIIITQDIAMKLFNKTDVLGKTLQFSFMESPLKITGILRNHPGNSSFDFGSVLSYASFQNTDGHRSLAASDWLSANFSVYALLKPNADSKVVAGQMSKLVHDNITPPAGITFSFSLQALKDIHLNSANIVDGARNSNVDPVAKGSMFYIKVFSFIAFFLLLIAGINYMNLTTARASSRLKEIGVRKTIGALQSNLMKQFLFESLLVTFISFLLALAIVNLLLPAFNQFTGKHLSFGLSTDYRIWIYAIAFAAIADRCSLEHPPVCLQLSAFPCYSI